MTVLNGIRQQQEFTTRQLVHQNAVSNVRNIIHGKTHSVLPTLRLQAARDFLQTQAGTQFRA